MKRIDFKNQEFLDWCKNNGAEYMEEDKDNDCYGVWVCHKKTRENGKLAIAFWNDNTFEFGKVDDNDDCKNFENEKYIEFHIKECEWIISILNILKKWKKK